jgi:hypothetical protein
MPWVAGHITGGLGNRLFQHAAALGLAEKWGHTPVFYLPKAAPTDHGPFGNLFQLFPKTPIITQAESHIEMPEPNGYVFTYLPFQEQPIVANILVDGWRQTLRYFPSGGVHVTWDTLLSDERQKALLQKYSLDMQSKQTCFVHIRLGDYKVLPHHQIDIGKYIQKAVQHFEPNTRFLVFSDEAVQYKQMLESIIQSVGHSPVVVEEADEIENLFLMSHCLGGAIVANSTFSWWGAYFARQRSSDPTSFKACYPTVWGHGLPIARDVIPSWGIRVDTV